MTDFPLRSVDPDLRAKIRQRIIADYGEHTMLPGNRMPPVRRLRTRSLGLDYITGGGYAFGMITRLWGGFSCGKSTMLFNAFHQAQKFGEIRHGELTRLADLARISGQLAEAKKMREQAKREQDRYACGMKVLYICTEKVFDPRLAVACGVDLDEDNFEIAMTRRIEEIGDIVQEGLAGYHIVAVDSSTGTISLDELGSTEGIYGESQDRTIGMIRAKKWGINLDWWQDRINSDNILLITSQIQSRIGMSINQKAAAEQAPGGNKLNHEPAIILHFMKGGALKRKKTGDGLEPVGDKGGEKGAFGRFQASGSEVVVKCEKNKTARDNRACLLHFDKDLANYDVLHDFEKLAKYFRVVEPTKEGSTWFMLPNGSKTQSLRAAIQENPELAREIEDVVLRCAVDADYEKQRLRHGAGEDLVPQLAAAS